MTNYAAFESFYYDVAMFIAFNSICSWFVLYTLEAAISQPHINFSVSFLTYFYILNMPVDINACRAVIGLSMNTTQQSAVFYLNFEALLCIVCYCFFCF